MTAANDPGDAGASGDSANAQYIEVWNDLVSPRDLVVSLALCAAATTAGLIIALLIASSAFFWGLGGATVGFILATVVIRPKRDVRIVDGPAHPGTASDTPPTAGDHA